MLTRISDLYLIRLFDYEFSLIMSRIIDKDYPCKYRSVCPMGKRGREKNKIQMRYSPENQLQIPTESTQC